MQSHDDSGYASITALVLCAAISLVCAGLLSMTSVQKKRADREMQSALQAEAINTALTQFGLEVLTSSATERLDKTASFAGGKDVKLSAENEQRKWPLKRASELSEVQLKHKARLNLIDIESAIAAAGNDSRPRPMNDCVRSLFSSYGQASLEGNVTPGASVITPDQAKDGQVWRLKATSGAWAEERQVRYTGDARAPFAIISRETYSTAEMPACTDLIRN